MRIPSTALLAGAISVSLAGVACYRAASPEPGGVSGSSTAPAARASVTPAINGGRVIAPIEDYSPQPPILPGTVQEEQQRFVLQLRVGRHRPRL